MLKIYKKYPNRRLYEITPGLKKLTADRTGYRTHDDLIEAIRAGHTVEVRDNSEQADITAPVLLQAFALHASAHTVLTAEALHQLVRRLS